MPPTILMLFIFVATFGLVIAGLYVATGWLKTGAVANRVGQGMELNDPEPMLLRTETVSSISFWASLLERFQFVPNLRRLIAESGLSWSVGRFTAMMMLAGASMAVVLSRVAWLPAIGVISGAVLAMLAPFFYVRMKRQGRFERFEENFPDALDSLGRAMQAGHSLSAGIELLAYESAQPVSGEFRLVLEEWRLGQNWDQVFDHLVHRMPLVSVSLFVAAVRMQSRTGGKLHEILGRISDGVRDSSSLEGEIRAISAHGKLTGAVLTVLPIGIAVMLHSTSPGYLDILRDHPIGKYMIVAAVVFLIAAHFVIRKILDIRI